MSALSQQHQPRKDRGNAAVRPTDDAAVVSRKKVDKQSWDYIWRSGTAGGLAGCAVRSGFFNSFSRPCQPTSD